MNMPSNASSLSSELDQMTQSRFILAKYRIQVVHPDKAGDTQPKLSDDITEDIEWTNHYHAGPEALGYYLSSALMFLIN